MWTACELALRSYGFALQVIGTFFAVREIFSNERLFDQPRLRDLVTNWWKYRPGRNFTIKVDTGHFKMTGGRARITQRAPLTPADSLETQIEKLWRNIEFIDKELQDLFTEAERNRRSFEGLVTNETKARESEHKRLEALLQEVAVGTPLLAYFGVALVLMGGAIATWSPELHQWVR